MGTGDFNDDMLPDILLQNTNGAIAIWETNGTSVTGSAVVANSGPNWHAIGTGDFNGDGHSDILLQNTSGAVAIWDMNGTSITSSAVVANPGANWKGVRTAASTAANHPDILLQNTNGTVAIWEMNRGERDQQRRPGQSRAQLACDRNERRLRHPVAEHERPNRDLGHERVDLPGICGELF